MSYPTDSSSRHLKIPFCPCSLIPHKPLLCQNEGDLVWISENKASNSALGQTPASLYERAESISGFTKELHLEIPTMPMWPGFSVGYENNMHFMKG